MTGATVLMICFIFISFFGPSLGAQLTGQILCGIPWGVYQTVTTVYASEVLPVNLRGYLTSYVNLYVSPFRKAINYAQWRSQMLGYRPVYCLRCPCWCTEPDRYMGLAVSLCYTVQAS